MSVVTFPPRSVIRVDGTLSMLEGAVVQPLHLTATPGETLATIMTRLGVPPEFVVVSILVPSGEAYGPIPAAWWPHVRPRLGRIVLVQIVPHGGGNGEHASGERKSASIMHMLGVFALSFVPYVGPILAVTVQFAGQMAIDAAFPPPTPKMDKLSGRKERDRESATLSIEGAQNRPNKYGPIPCVYGQTPRWPGWR